MENKKCLKCKNAIICKYHDSLDTIEAQFPFIESFECKFFEAGGSKKPTITSAVNSTAPTAMQPTQPKTRGRKPIITVGTTAPSKKETKPETKTETKPSEKPNKAKASDDFRSLQVTNLNLRPPILSELKASGVTLIGDLYDKSKQKTWTKDMIKEINNTLLIFNQPTI